MIAIREYVAADRAAVAMVHEAAFDGVGEADLVEALHACGAALVSLVAVRDEAVVGHVLFSRLDLMLDDRSVSAAALAPVGVTPSLQARGIGSALIHAGLEDLRRDGVAAVLVLGEPAYYGRFGFEPALAARIACPYAGPYLMGLELVPGTLRDATRGRAVYAAPFAALE